LFSCNQEIFIFKESHFLKNFFFLSQMKIPRTLWLKKNNQSPTFSTSILEMIQRKFETNRPDGLNFNCCFSIPLDKARALAKVLVGLERFYFIEDPSRRICHTHVKTWRILFRALGSGGDGPGPGNPLVNLKLKKLKCLQNRFEADEFLPLLSDLLLQCPQLKTFSFSDAPHFNVQPLFSLLNLTSLSLSHVHLSYLQANQVFQAIDPFKIVKLNLSGNPGLRDAFPSLLAFVHHPESRLMTLQLDDTHFSSDQCDSLLANLKVHTLTLRGQYFGADAKSLAFLIKENVYLRHLDASFALSLASDGVKNVALALGKNTTLETFQFLFHPQPLYNFGLSFSDWWVEGLKGNKTLKELSLSHGNHATTNANFLNHVRKNPQLKVNFGTEFRTMNRESDQIYFKVKTVCSTLASLETSHPEAQILALYLRRPLFSEFY
jgi:hypothetical protein